MEYVKFGSIYWNGKPIQYDHVELFSGKTQSLTVGNTVPGCEIQFVRWGKLLVGECNACNNLSWDVLDKNGLIFGCFVTIDGQQYFCRSPQGGVFNGALNEWDCFLQALAHDEPEHPWFTANYCSKHGSFWCQETSGNWPRQKVVRAPTDVVKWKHMETDFKSPIVGFLPILEPVEAVIPPEKLVGQRVKVYGKGASATGRLVSVDNYDLCLSSGTCSMPSQEWIDKKETNITISRDSVLWVRPV